MQAINIIKSTLAAALLAGLAGCQTYHSKERDALEAWRASDVQGAAQAFTARAERENRRDAIIWRLEAGTALRAAGQFDQSTRLFDEAEARIDQHEQEAKVRVGQEVISVLGNPAETTYVGRTYDKIMVDTYKALNDMELGQLDRARVDLTRAYHRQQDAVAENAARIEKESKQAAAEKPDAQPMAQSAERDPRVQSALDNAYSDVRALPSYGDYVNPFTVYLDGLFFMAAGTDGSDWQRAEKSLERAEQLSGHNPYIAQDLQTMHGLMNGGSLPPTTYVIFETGLAPVREQVRVDIPLFISGVRDVPYLGAAFPVLKMEHGALRTLLVSGGGARETTATVCSMDSVIGKEFQNEIPLIITKTIIATVAKAAGAYGVTRVAEEQGGPIAGLLARIATTATQVAINIADTRTWTTLPKEFQICRLPTPADRRIVVSSPTGAPQASVGLLDGTVNVVVVKSILAGGPFEISQFKLK
ncbi:MAG TPA: hypothetical protein VHB20_08555 [Verrucomicrobiae bacterium]|jgi:hypothetical protein|nr:hypothetical protein [Verrucomicrobiae bacterium]